jgi:nucleosome binding factor SPN SPT16 subunit
MMELKISAEAQRQAQLMDELAALKRQQADYQTLRAKAIEVLEDRRQTERKKTGKVRTKISQVTIAGLLR